MNNQKTQLVENLKNAETFLNSINFSETNTVDDLKKKDLRKLFSILTKDIELDSDGDSDGVSMYPENVKSPLIFWSRCEYTEDFEKYIYDVHFDEDQSENILTTLRELISYMDMGVTYVNLTPHAVNLINPETKEIDFTFKSEGSVRVGTKNIIQKDNKGVPIGTTEYTELEGLPEQKENTIYILSSIAFNAGKLKGRKDICFPSGQMFRDENGNILGVEFLSF